MPVHDATLTVTDNQITLRFDSNDLPKMFSAGMYRRPEDGRYYLVIDDGYPRYPSSSCTPSDQVVACSTARPYSFRILGSPGDEEISLSARASAGETSFALPTAVRLDTRAGADRIDISNVTTDVAAGKGSDLVRFGRSSYGALATPGDEIHGGRGEDTVSYEYVDAYVRVVLDEKANDGPSGEQDFIHPDVENLIGPKGGFTAIGSAADNDLSGNKGDDHLVGRGGADLLAGGGGDDRLDARDGKPGDRISCGNGTDLALLDRGDRILHPASCEKIRWASSAR